MHAEVCFKARVGLPGRDCQKRGGISCRPLGDSLVDFERAANSWGTGCLFIQEFGIFCKESEQLKHVETFSSNWLIFQILLSGWAPSHRKASMVTLEEVDARLVECAEPCLQCWIIPSKVFFSTKMMVNVTNSFFFWKWSIEKKCWMFRRSVFQHTTV